MIHILLLKLMTVSGDSPGDRARSNRAVLTFNAAQTFGKGPSERGRRAPRPDAQGGALWLTPAAVGEALGQRGNPARPPASHGRPRAPTPRDTQQTLAARCPCRSLSRLVPGTLALSWAGSKPEDGSLIPGPFCVPPKQRVTPEGHSRCRGRWPVRLSVMLALGDAVVWEAPCPGGPCPVWAGDIPHPLHHGDTASPPFCSRSPSPALSSDRHGGDA